MKFSNISNNKQNILALSVAFTLLGFSAQAQAVDSPLDNLDVSADLRLRYESDWNSSKSDNTMRDDRTRARMRARLNLSYKIDGGFSVGVRARTGSNDSHQSPHITFADFNDNPTGDAHVNLDKYYAKYSADGLSVWAGRNSIAYWKQNEIFWDDDVTPLGGALSYSSDVNDGNISFNAGFYKMPVGMRKFSGEAYSGQAVYKTTVGNTGFTIGSGIIQFKADPADLDGAMLLRGNGSRDYTMWTTSAQVKLNTGDRPVSFGVDFIQNLKTYSGADAAYNGDRTGFTFTATYGSTSKPGDWMVRYVYAQIERLAVNSSYAGDDWVRWGSATETRQSDMKAHQFRADYKIMKSLTAVARLYLAKQIMAPAFEDGNRFRLDFNYSF